MLDGSHEPSVYRRTAGTATVALLAVIALALAAAGIPSPVVIEDGGGVGEGTGSGVGQGTGDGAGATDGGFERPDWLAPLIAATFALLRVLGSLAILLLVASFVYVAVTRHRALLDALRDLLARLPWAIIQVVTLAAIALALLSLWPNGAIPEASPVVPIPGEGGGSTSGSTAIAPRPITILAVVLGLAAVSIVVLRVVRSRSRSRDDDSDDADADDADADEAVLSTGDSDDAEQTARSEAERIRAGGSPADAVVDAWREMATRLDGVDRRTATPRQFAARAIAAGVDRDDVEVLTRLFEDVRYGDVELTDDQEARALRAFRRIETAYGDGRDGS